MANWFRVVCQNTPPVQRNSIRYSASWFGNLGQRPETPSSYSVDTLVWSVSFWDECLRIDHAFAWARNCVPICLGNLSDYPKKP